jgi:hypothetical protein
VCRTTFGMCGAADIQQRLQMICGIGMFETYSRSRLIFRFLFSKRQQKKQVNKQIVATHICVVFEKKTKKDWLAFFFVVFHYVVAPTINHLTFFGNGKLKAIVSIRFVRQQTYLFKVFLENDFFFSAIDVLRTTVEHWNFNYFNLLFGILDSVFALCEAKHWR